MEGFSKQIGIRGGGEENMNPNSVLKEQMKGDTNPEDFVIDMESISLLSSNNDELVSFCPQVPVALKLQKNLSRKASQRIERKTNSNSNSNPPPASDGGDEENSQCSRGILESTTFRRKRTSSVFFDPRRVLFFFATLSSMGTLILLYFTMSMGQMGQMDGGHNDGQ